VVIAINDWIIDEAESKDKSGEDWSLAEQLLDFREDAKLRMAVSSSAHPRDKSAISLKSSSPFLGSYGQLTGSLPAEFVCSRIPWLLRAASVRLCFVDFEHRVWPAAWVPRITWGVMIISSVELFFWALLPVRLLRRGSR